VNVTTDETIASQTKGVKGGFGENFVMIEEFDLVCDPALPFKEVTKTVGYGS
jgi:hypothetical protein